MTVSQTKKPIVPMFLQWYFLEAPRAVVIGTIAYVTAIAEIFPFVFLVRTIFCPWKNIVDRTVMHGIDLNRIAEKLSLGLLARLVGAVVRTTTIFLGLIIESMTILYSIIFLIAWILFPVLFFLGMSLCVRLL